MAETSQNSWNEIFELDSNMREATRNAFIRLLDNWSDSHSGQTLLKLGAETQPHIPQGALRHIPAASDNTPPTANRPDWERLLGAANERRKDDRKILLVALEDEGPNSELYLRLFELGGATTLREMGIILIDPQTLALGELPKKDKQGNKVLLPPLLHETLAHEAHHAITELHRRFVSHEPPLSEACFEEQGLNAEQAFAREKFPDAPIRHAYADPEEAEGDIPFIRAQAGRTINQQKGINPTLMNMVSKERIYRAKLYEFEAGCAGITSEEAIRRADNFLRHHGIPEAYLPPLKHTHETTLEPAPPTHAVNTTKESPNR